MVVQQNDASVRTPNDANAPGDYVSESFEGAYTDTEIVIGLVGAMGTQLHRVVEILQDRLRAFRYDPQEIRVSEDIIKPLFESHSSEFDSSSEYTRIMAYIRDGNEARKNSKDPSVLALGVCSKAYGEREKDEGDVVKPRRRTAYIINSLKHPAEVARLRNVYADGFYLIGVHSDKRQNLEHLVTDKRVPAEQAEALIRIDEHEEQGHGQQTRDTFHLADFFVNVSSDEKTLKNSLQRMLDLVFMGPEITPTFDEYAMFMAFASALRSGDLSRQVGAVIARDNEIIATGANDCPKAGGGLYWPIYDEKECQYIDEKNGRDGVRGEDSNKRELHRMVEDILDRLGDTVDRAKAKEQIEKSKLKELTEYGRAVHAEMEALLFCARNTIHTRGATLYATLFPCHNCAKHMIAAGIKRAVYIEPYPKSKAIEFHDDAITTAKDSPLVVFVPFVGVGPRKFFDLFSMDWSTGYPLQRKDADGRALHLQRDQAYARIQMPPCSYLQKETRATERYANLRKMIREMANE